ncbi:MAG TPA: hypothetical protein VLD67_04170 [Vicinamibacterales bacterium]|nr:hypothetical protein [Vicinamibacterales bacterium]
MLERVVCGMLRVDPDQPYHVELSELLKTNLLGTPLTRKARWVRLIPNVDLAVLGVASLDGRPVVAAFDEADFKGARYVALYRKKHWPAESASDAPSCGGHVHLQGTWAVLPTAVQRPQ